MNLTLRLTKTLLTFSILWGGFFGYAQSIVVNANDVKQKVEIMGADFERSQNFAQQAANTDEVMDWVFKDINFNLARVAYDKVQNLENEKYAIEANNINATGTYVQWRLQNGNGFFYIQNLASNTRLQTTGALTDDEQGIEVYSRRANTCTGSWCKWELIESDNYPGYYLIRSVGHNKYLKVVTNNTGQTGVPVIGVTANATNANDEDCLWSIKLKNNASTNITVDQVNLGSDVLFIDNKGTQKRLRYTDVDEVVENMAFYNNAIKTMQSIKAINPNVKFLATMRSDYHGYNSGNRNNLPEYIYQYSCVEENASGQCIRTLGNKSFNANAYGIFLADYLELMHNNGVTIDYLATAKEWTSVVTPQRSSVATAKMQSECNLRGVPVPQIIGPASWSLSQGANYINTVKNSGYENEYHSFSSHNLNNQPELYADFTNAGNSVNKKVWNDETSTGGGGRTHGVEPDINGVLNAYIDKTVFYKDGLVGECFFEVTSRGVGSETRAIYFKNNTTGERLRSYYVMKDFANGVVDKNYITTTVNSLADVHTMAFKTNEDFTLVIINNGDNDINNVPVTFNGLQFAENVKIKTWTNSTVVQGEETTLTKSNNQSFNTNLKAKSINIYTKKSTLHSQKFTSNNTTVKLIKNPVLNNQIELLVKDDFLGQKKEFSLYNLKGQKVLNGVLSKTNKIKIQDIVTGLYLLKIKSNNINTTLKVIKSQE